MSSEASQIVTGHNLIIMRVSEHNLPAVAEQFAEAFSLEIEPAEQILRSTPIVFLTGLNKETIKILKDRLVNLSKIGVEFMISTRLSPTIPRVIWPGKMPNYATAPSGELIKYVDFQWRGNAFVCPNCAETFVFKRIGNPLARYLQVKEETPPKQAAPDAPTRSKAKDTVSDISESDDVVELPPLTDTKSDSDSDEVVELAPLEEQSQNNADTLEPIDILEETAANEEAPAVAIQNSPEDDAQVIEAPMVVEENNATGTPNECICSLFLTSIPPDKKTAAAELIAKMKNIPAKQAQVLVTRLLVPILKDVDKAEATQCLEEFQKIGVKGKLTIKK